jgi:hypothetical protein
MHLITSGWFCLYSYIDELALAGRLRNTRQQNNKRGKAIADTLMLAGHDQLITWESDTTCTVPSQGNPETIYRVNLGKATCECPASTQEGLFKAIFDHVQCIYTYNFLI